VKAIFKVKFKDTPLCKSIFTTISLTPHLNYLQDARKHKQGTI